MIEYNGKVYQQIEDLCYFENIPIYKIKKFKNHIKLDGVKYEIIKGAYVCISDTVLDVSVFGVLADNGFPTKEMAELYFPKHIQMEKEIEQKEKQERELEIKRIKKYAFDKNIDISDFFHPEICENCGDVFDGYKRKVTIQNGKQYCEKCWNKPNSSYFYLSDF